MTCRGGIVALYRVADVEDLGVGVLGILADIEPADLQACSPARANRYRSVCTRRVSSQ